jgi:hypothetical protein
MIEYFRFNSEYLKSASERPILEKLKKTKRADSAIVARAATAESEAHKYSIFIGQ